jgi:hypothetical protein
MPGTLAPLDNRPPALPNRRASGMLAAARAGVQASFAVIGYKGRTWSLKHRGEKILLRDDRGTPTPQLDVVIVGVANAISKIYYERGYVEGDDNPPDCFSLDGITPDAAAPNKQHDVCATCRHNQWGSRITDAGKRAKSCQDSRRIAVVPLGDIQNEQLGGPMLLRIPPTSLPNLANYSDLLERKSADFNYVGTRISFDYNVAYPKLEFQALGWLTTEQAVQVVGTDGNGGVCANPLIDRMLNDFGPTEPAAAAAADADPLAGQGPAEVFKGKGNGSSKVIPIKASDPPAPEPEPEPEEQGPPAPPPAEPEPEKPAATNKNPFAAAAKQQAAAAPAKAPPKATPSKQAAMPSPAPADLEAAIGDLLDA